MSLPSPEATAYSDWPPRKRACVRRSLQGATRHSATKSSLSQRRWFESALALERRNKLFERKILVGERREGRRTNPTQDLTRTGIATQTGAENHRIGQRADEVLGARAVAVGDERSHTQVIFTHVAMQQRFEGSDERHEQRAALSGAEAFGRLRQPCGQSPLPPRGAEAVERPFPTRDAKLHHWQRIAELLTPVCQLRNDVRMRIPFPLPRCKVRVLDRERGERRRLAGGEGVVQGGKLLNKHPERPAIADDLVHGNEQEVFPLAQTQQASPQ